MTSTFKSHRPLPPKKRHGVLGSAASQPYRVTAQDSAKAQGGTLSPLGLNPVPNPVEGFHRPQGISGQEEKITRKEIGGPEGLEPTRYGDWERRGICVDF